MRSLLLLVAGLLLACNAASEEKKIVCYFNSWAIYRPEGGQMLPSDIDAQLCSHVIYNIAGITSEGNLRVTDPNADLPSGRAGYRSVNQLRLGHPKLKVLIAVGGFSEGSVRFSRIAADQLLRANFVSNAVAFVKRHGFDGMDLQWSYPSPADTRNFVLLLQLLKERLAQENLILSALLMGVQSSTVSYDVPRVMEHLDFANIIAFDLNGSWNRVTGINAPLYPGSWEYGWSRHNNMDAIVTDWLKQGAPADKLVVSIPTYGRSFTLDSVESKEIGASASQPGYPGRYTRTPGMLGYNEICEELLNNVWEQYYQQEQRVPYMIRQNQWVGYDNAESVNEKVDYIRSHNLGGASVYTLDTDDFRGYCGPAYLLLKMLNNLLR